ncbi:(2Fe-2S)-binding protein [Fulvivirgaceae bacterium BMA10]|uniref:(2Fe-2S)-binding protein n=1 Tax=Splendidivirga corallicola TaxID=3051826 RepID=A0ABT8KMJ5_9BACT|nr:(2Fe-2S)-binding protein [Fulvivirgaceae bacterium BMA10]
MDKSTFVIHVNGQKHRVEVESNTPLLWVIREHIGLMGTKFGCGVAQCGACTIHLNGNPVRSCVLPVSAAEGSEITTIEGISEDNSHPLQKAWIAEQVPQCGYCQSGQIMQAVALLEKNKKPSREEIITHMNGVICRCGTYVRIIKAIERATLEG